jgi:hypothetical protein
MSYTKEEIKMNLSRNPKWIERALVVLHNLQTTEEQITNETIKENGVGFNSSDSRYLSYCAKWIKGGNHLNEKHLTKCGQKLPKYWKQIHSMIK